MADTMVHLERHGDGVAVITLDNPKVNALCAALLGELLAISQDLHADLPGAVIVTGGDRVFAAGADISEFGGADEARRIGPSFHAALNSVAALACPVIASVSGYALGGGCELAMACDFRIASEKAVFGQPEILLGIIPGGGGTQRLTRLVGPARSKDIIFSGRQVPAAEALAIGLADEVVPHETLADRCRELAASYAAGPRLSIGLAKRAIDGGLETTLETGLRMELDAFTECFATEDSQIGVKSFLENGPGKAKFTGR